MTCYLCGKQITNGKFHKRIISSNLVVVPVCNDERNCFKNGKGANKWRPRRQTMKSENSSTEVCRELDFDSALKRGHIARYGLDPNNPAPFKGALPIPLNKKNTTSATNTGGKSHKDSKK